MSIRTNIAAIVVFIYLCAGTASATETLPCKAGDLIVMMHIGSEGLGDLQIFVNEQTYFLYLPEDFSSLTFAWPSGKKPYHGDRISAKRLKGTDDLPSLTMKVQGRFGMLRFMGRKQKVDCDWRWAE